VRHPKAAAAGVVLLLLAAGLGAHFWAVSEERAARKAISQERYADARLHADHYLTVWRRSASAHLLAARVARLQGDYPAAETHLRRSAELSGGPTAGTQLEWLMLRAQAGDVDEVAAGLFRLVEDNDPESPMILEALSGAYVRQMRLQPALSCLNQWLKREPDSVPALDRRGWTWGRLNNRVGAQDDWERALQLAPDRWQTRLRLAELFLDDSDPVQASPHVERLWHDHSDRPEVWALRGRCQYLQGDLPGAAESFDRVLAAAPDDPTGLLWRARVALEEGGAAQAEALLRRALTAEPYFIEAHYTLWQSLSRQPGRQADADAQKRRYDGMKADVERLTALMNGDRKQQPESAETCAEVGRLLLRLGRKEMALGWLRRALHADEKCKPAHEAMATYFEQVGNAEEAERERRLAEGEGP
jgi:tetratricopeptide (TPR) repeat protein